jgi:drug/metabolite transporter (DMT)-like permease
MVVSLVAALVCALSYGIASVMQAIAVRASSRRPPVTEGGGSSGVDPGLVLRMFGQWPFLVSIALDMIGFVGQVVALRRLPLFAVQAITAANLAVTAVLASWLLHMVLGAREWIAISGVVAGVGLLGSTAGAQGANPVGVSFQLALMVAVVVLALTGLAAARLPQRYRTLALGATAGLGFGVLAVCARILPGFTPHQLLHAPASFTLAAAGIVSFMLYATALDGGSVTVATAAVILVETIPPAVVGALLLGDTARPGLNGLAWLGFTLAVFSAIMLARFGSAAERQRAAGSSGSKVGSSQLAGPPA